MEIKPAEYESIKDFRLPTYAEIPDVGLYLKQVVKYINDEAGRYLGFSVTDSMLSNYVKMHMVANPVKKAYYRDHIATLMFISMAKSVLSLEHIDIVLKLQKEKYETEKAYELFRTAFKNTLEAVYGNSVAASKDKSITDDQSLLHDIVVAMSYKFYLDACLRNAIE